MKNRGLNITVPGDPVAAPVEPSTPEERAARRKTVARAEAAAACRWSCNNLAEVVGNHGGHLPAEAREQIKVAIQALANAGINL